MYGLVRVVHYNNWEDDILQGLIQLQLSACFRQNSIYPGPGNPVQQIGNYYAHLHYALGLLLVKFVSKTQAKCEQNASKTRAKRYWLAFLPNA